LCRKIGLPTKASVAIDGSKFKAVNNRDKNFTKGRVERRLCQSGYVRDGIPDKRPERASGSPLNRGSFILQRRP